MRLFKYALFLVVLVYFVLVAAADVDEFYISSGVYASSNSSPTGLVAYTFNSPMTVTAESDGAIKMLFSWYTPDGRLVHNVNDQTVPFTDTYTPNMAGSWTIKVVDVDPRYPVNQTAYLYFWIEHPTITYTYSITGTQGTNGLLINYPVTATVTSSSSVNDGVSMIFEWYPPLSSTAIRTWTASKSGTQTYTDILPLEYFDTAGDWTIRYYEYSNISCSANTLIGSDSGTFTGEDTPEFPLGSFVPLLLAGAVYIKVRRNKEGS